MGGPYRSPLHETVSTTPTDLWNDSCSPRELAYAIEHGATGATTNPTIVLDVLRAEMDAWRDRIRAIAAEDPRATETDVAWRLIEEMAVAGAAMLRPIFDRERGRKGRLSIQTDPRLHRDADALAAQAIRFAALAPNMQVKIPATCAGIRAIEEATAAGVSINATVSFTVPQSLAVGEAVERGLRRREAAGLDVATMRPVCTLMVGRLDDWLKVVAKRDGIVTTPGHLDWAGIAAFKRACALVRERGLRTRMLAAAYRHHLHWTELVGGDVVLTIPYAWQRLFNASGLPVVPRFDAPVDPAIVAALAARFPDFVRAYEPDGLAIADFDTYGATVRTLRTFLASAADLVATVRDVLLPDPDRPAGGAP